MEHSTGTHTTVVGTVSGTALTILVNIGTHDVLKTILLAIVGAITSFVVTQILKWILKKLKNVFSN